MLFKEETDKDLTFFKSVLLNSLFCYTDKDGIGCGAEDHFGLFIEKNL
jgi:hypothetical protein